jgi:hypothetical protein
MTQSRDIERLLDAWLAEGPMQVPDRVFDDAVVRLRREPARRPWHLPWRNHEMTVPIRLAAAAVAIVAIVGVGLALNLTSNVGPEPSPSRTPGASPNPTAASTPRAVACETGLRLDGRSVTFECLGALTAGNYSTDNTVVPFTYTVPDGWANTFDIDGGYMLAYTGSPAAAIFVWLDPLVADQSACEPAPGAGFGEAAADIVGFLASADALVGSQPQAVSLGGLEGQQIDFEVADVAPGSLEPCPDRVQLFVHSWSAEDGYWWDVRRDGKSRAIVLDAPGGHTVLIEVDARKADFDAVIAAAQPVIDTFQFADSARQTRAPLCPTSDPSCTGPLAPGEHRTDQLYTPMAYTVPFGWQKPLDVPGALNLESDDWVLAILAVWPEWRIAAQSACTSDPEPGRGQTVEELVSFLTSHPGLVATTPAAVTIGGLSGQMLDIEAAPTWRGPCGPSVNLFTHVGTVVEDVGWIEIGQGVTMRLAFLETEGNALTVGIEARTPQSFEAVAAAAMPIIESFDFTP